MTKFVKDKAPLVFLLLFILSVCPFVAKLFKKEIQNPPSYELFQPELSRLNTLEKLSEYTDSVYKSNNPGRFDTGAYAATLSHITKQRFYHGCLDYDYSDNWIAAFAGKVFWSHISSIVVPEDILKHSKGLCSQQTIVFMNLLRMKNINVRSVGLGYKEGPGHFLCEVRYNGLWHIHDVSIEPVWSNISNDHLSMNHYLTKKDSLFLVYESKLPRALFYKLLEKVVYGKVNEMPAKNMALFHKITLALTYLFPVVFLGLYIVSIRRKKTLSSVMVSTSLTGNLDPVTELYAEKALN